MKLLSKNKSSASRQWSKAVSSVIPSGGGLYLLDTEIIELKCVETFYRRLVRDYSGIVQDYWHNCLYVC